MATKYAAGLMSKAMFVDVLVEGTNPSTAITKSQLGLWASSLKLPFTVLRDPDGVGFVAKKTLGIKMTTYIVERATRKIVAKGDNEADMIPTLEGLP